jgi:hypothetical protein
VRQGHRGMIQATPARAPRKPKEGGSMARRDRRSHLPPTTGGPLRIEAPAFHASAGIDGAQPIPRKAAQIADATGMPAIQRTAPGRPDRPIRAHAPVPHPSAPAPSGSPEMREP